MSRPLALALSAAVTGLALVAWVDAAVAATPVAKARYAGVGSGNTAWAEVRVSRDRRSFRRGRSAFELVLAGCGRPESRRVFPLGTRRRRARISRRGRFRFVRRRGGAVFRISGRFKSRNTVRARFRYRSGDCDEAGQVTLRRVRRGSSAGCARRARTLLWTPQARVFKLAVPTGDQYVPNIRFAYGCLFSRRKAFRLAEDEEQQPDSDLRLFRLAGPYVAYAQDACPMGCGYSVSVVDLRNGRPVRQAVAGVPGPGSPYGGPASDLVLKANSSVAWISSGNPTRVFADDGSGKRQLDSGGGIVLTSLELSDSTVSWLKGGTRRSTILF